MQLRHIQTINKLISLFKVLSLWLRSDRDVDFSGRPVLTGWLPTFLADNGIVLFVWGLQANHPGRFYREVWIGLGGTHSAVYATEVSDEEYAVYTTCLLYTSRCV